jgi:hypothetical protein
MLHRTVPALLLALFASLCAACTEGRRSGAPLDAGGCPYTVPGAPACCNDGHGCGGALWCNRGTCSCEDIESPCGSAGPGVVPGDGGTPDAGPAPAGTVGPDGGVVTRLWFATTGDTRPAQCDATDAYPRAAIAELAASMKALHVQFALDLGDHMFVCNQSYAEATQQMGFYMEAIAFGPSTWLMTMGNHECGQYDASTGGTYGCFDPSADANFHAYMAALGRPKPYYAVDVQTDLGLARFVQIADDSWDAAQAAWLEQTLADADAHARYTIVARHHPVSGTRVGNADIVAAVERHKYTLILTAHNHSYSHGTDHGGRAAIIGLGGASPGVPPGFATVLQNADGTLTVTLRDGLGNPVQTAWSVAPQ